MRVTRAGIRDFRNYTDAEVWLGGGLTVVHGPNGAGKTNLLEAVYFGLTARSCRAANEREVVRHGARVTRVELETEAEDGTHLLEVGFEPGEAKRVAIDGVTPNGSLTDRARPLAGVFLPDRMDLVKGPPARRRAHLDSFVAALWPARGETRSAYGRALAQRNALLARVRAGAAAPSHLDPWDVELARAAARLMDDRSAATELLAPAFRERAEQLGLAGAAGIRYRPRVSARDPEAIAAELGARRAEDLARGFTTHGPHRDDVVLLHDERSLRAFGSQGQQRVALLALLLSERDVLERHSRAALMLLDDVMSELDAGRRERLAELVQAGGQAVVTATDRDHVPGARDAGVTVVAVAGGRLGETPAAVAA